MAVDNLSFEVPGGAILGLVGQNGAGKTTTLRALSGIIPPTEGRLLIDGMDIVKQPKETKQRLAYIPDEPRLFEGITVWEHLHFNAVAYQVADWQSKAEQLLEQFELSDRKDSAAGELSRGMKQKVAICCNFLYDPKAILFDEPHTGLDPQAIRTMKQAILDRAASGAAVIVSSHLLVLIEDLCSHLLILAKGKSRFCGSLEELKRNYADLGADNSLEEIFLQTTSSANDSGKLSEPETAPEEQSEPDSSSAAAD